MERLIYFLYMQNKNKAFEYIYKNYYKKIYSLTYKIIIDKNECEDIVQEVFIKILENIEKFKWKSSLWTWIYRISINHIINRNKKLDLHLELKEDIYYLENKIELDIELKELDEEINKALNSLKEIDKKVFILREIEGFSYEKIAKILDIKEGTVKSKLYYSKLKLKEVLKNHIK